MADSNHEINDADVYNAYRPRVGEILSLGTRRKGKSTTKFAKIPETKIYANNGITYDKYPGPPVIVRTARADPVFGSSGQPYSPYSAGYAYTRQPPRKPRAKKKTQTRKPRTKVTTQKKYTWNPTTGHYYLNPRTGGRSGAGLLRRWLNGKDVRPRPAPSRAEPKSATHLVRAIVHKSKQSVKARVGPTTLGAVKTSVGVSMAVARETMSLMLGVVSAVSSLAFNPVTWLSATVALMVIGVSPPQILIIIKTLFQIPQYAMTVGLDIAVLLLKLRAAMAGPIDAGIEWVKWAGRTGDRVVGKYSNLLGKRTGYMTSDGKVIELCLNLVNTVNAKNHEYSRVCSMSDVGEETIWRFTKAKDVVGLTVCAARRMERYKSMWHGGVTSAKAAHTAFKQSIDAIASVAGRSVASTISAALNANNFMQAAVKSHQAAVY